MSTKDDHLEELKELTHKKADKAKLGCLTRHEAYKGKAWPDCNYRKNAHDYAIANHTNVYDVPSGRSPVRWLEFTLGFLEPVKFAASSPQAGQVRKATPLSPLAHPNAWNLTFTIADATYNPKGESNFHHEDFPYFHNTHHIYSCDELYRAFTFAELQILVTAKYNINRNPNVIILPKQKCVAWALKLPAHCPDKCEHEDYSTRVRSKLSSVKSAFQENAEDTGHQITDANAPDLVKQMETDSKELHDFLIATGYSNPGIDLDLVTLP
jgi:hypothetical protein